MRRLSIWAIPGSVSTVTTSAVESNSQAGAAVRTTNRASGCSARIARISSTVRDACPNPCPEMYRTTTTNLRSRDADRQRHFECFLESRDGDECQIPFDFRRELREVRFVARGQNELLDPV